jgi:hypothetical protein
VARTKSQRADEDALDPVEAADVEHADDPDAGLLELDPEVEPEDDPDEPDDLDLDANEPDDPTSDDPSALDGGDDVPDDVDEDAVALVVLPDAAFDDDDDVVATVVVDADEDDDDEIEGVRDGEFVCRRCYMAMRETQLADAERLLCRDCA